MAARARHPPGGDVATGAHLDFDLRGTGPQMREDEPGCVDTDA